MPILSDPLTPEDRYHAAQLAGALAILDDLRAELESVELLENASVHLRRFMQYLPALRAHLVGLRELRATMLELGE